MIKTKIKKTIKKQIVSTSEIEPIHFMFRTVALAALLVLGALGTDIYRLLH
jgi:hypothetical protein